MKELILISLLVCGVVSEAPYAPSGWKPSGPSFELPERAPVDPRNRTPQKQEFIPPSRTPQEYGPPEVDVSVQGLPTQEQLPIFQLSPVNGQQYSGPSFNQDLRILEQNLRSRQLQAQQNAYREFARQSQLEAAFANSNRVNQAIPRQFVPSSTTTPRPDNLRTTTVESTTSLNEGEVKNEKDDKEKVSVEVSQQNIQEYPPELFLTPLAQLQLQNQYSPVQLGQLRAPIYLEPSQNYQAAQLAALPAYLAQQQLLRAQLAQTQAQLMQAQAQPQPQLVQTQPEQSQQGVATPAYLVPQDQALVPQQTQVQYQPANQYAPANQYETVTPQVYSQQPVFLQPQKNQLLPRPKDQQVPEQDQSQIQPQQFVYQYQQAQYPQQYQLQYQQPLNSYQQVLQPQVFIQDPQSQRQQTQDSLQSGFNVNQQGNGVEHNEDKDDEQDDGSATAVATAFGTRTQPRTYGAPIPRVQANPGYQYPVKDQTATEVPTEEGSVAEATAAAKGRRPTKLRNRQGRVRPVFTLDKSGHLVLAQEK